jgi:UDP-glucose 4-epimerase
MIGTTNVFEYAKKCKKLKKVIYVSSAAVYWQAKSKLQKETDQIDPHRIYWVSKYSTELLAKIYSEQLNIPFIWLRYSIIFGLNERYGRVLTLFIKNSITKNKIVVFWDWHEVRDYCNVKDVVSAHKLFIEKDPPLKNNIYNISSWKWVTINKLAEIVAKISWCELLYENVKEWESSKILNDNRIKLPWNLEYLCQDNQKVYKEFWWQPEVNFEEWVLEEFNRYKDNHQKDKWLWGKLFY